MASTPCTDKYPKTGYAFELSSRCGAKCRTRGGEPCRSPAVKGKRRCRMHGGAKGSGGQKGNQNRLVHGCYTKLFTEERRYIMRLLREYSR